MMKPVGETSVHRSALHHYENDGDDIVPYSHERGRPSACIEKGRPNEPLKVLIDGMIVREMLRRCKYNEAVMSDLRKLLEGEWVCKDSSRHHQKMVKTLWAHYERTGFLSTRILEHLDSYSLHIVDIDTIRWTMNRLPAKPFNVLTTHDCFRVLPNYGNDLRRQYNNLLEEIARSDLLGDILTQLTGDQWDSFKLDPNLADDIVNAEYALS